MRGTEASGRISHTWARRGLGLLAARKASLLPDANQHWRAAQLAWPPQYSTDNASRREKSALDSALPPAAAALVVACLTGCGTVFPYNSSSTCPQIGEGVCASAREVYTATNTKDSVDYRDVRPASTNSGATVPAPAAVLLPAPGIISGPTLPTSTGAESIIPLRTPSVVMRIWIAPWETETGDLVLSGYVFTELHERRWQVGNEDVGAASSLRPVGTLSEDDASADPGTQQNISSTHATISSSATAPEYRDSQNDTSRGSDTAAGFFQQ